MKDTLRLIKHSSFRHMVYELKGGYVLAPAIIMMVLSIVAVALPALETSDPWLAGWSRHLTWYNPRDAAMVQLLLGAVAGSCITILSVVYSVLLIALTFASIQFSPRILTSFVKDRVSQTTLGVFIGTFAYCLILLPSVRTGTKLAMPGLSITVALVLAAVCIFYLIYFIHHIALSIQANYIVDRIAGETEDVLRSIFGAELKGFPPAPELPTEPADGKVAPSTRSGYIQYIDEARLFACAVRSNVTVYVNRSVGQFIPAGIPLITVSASLRADDIFLQDCLDCFRIGPMRTMEDDVEFGILQMVDVALKAISPAVNDPSMAISCVDHLSRILILAARLEPPTSSVLDEKAVLRLVRRQTSFPRLLSIAFDQISPYGKGDMAVSLRLMRALQDISSVTNYPPYLGAIRQQAQRIVKACTACFAEEDCTELKDRLSSIEQHGRSSI